MKTVPAETDYLVVGAGVAGMRAAIELAAAGRVLVLAKNELTESATQYAQGGVQSRSVTKTRSACTCRTPSMPATGFPIPRPPACWSRKDRRASRS